MHVALQLDNNQGYSAEQVETSLTLGQLAALLDEAIELHGEDAVVVTQESGNRYGASFGRIRARAYSTVEDVFVSGENDECATCGGYLGDDPEMEAAGYGHDEECPEA